MYDKTTFVLKRVFGGTEETIDIMVSFRPSTNIQYASYYGWRYLIVFSPKKVFEFTKGTITN